MFSQEAIIIVGFVAFLLISLSIHEAAHALVAYWCGDDTAKSLGRLTINPIKHIDFWMSIVMPILTYWALGFPFGGAKPVPVNPYRLRNPSRDMALVAIAGPLSNIILAFIFLFSYSLAKHFEVSGEIGLLWLSVAGRANIALAIFNMLPIPPLDGSRVMGYLLPKPISEYYLKLEAVGLLIVVGLLYFTKIGYMLSRTIDPVYYWMKDVSYSILGV